MFWTIILCTIISAIVVLSIGSCPCYEAGVKRSKKLNKDDQGLTANDRVCLCGSTMLFDPGIKDHSDGLYLHYYTCPCCGFSIHYSRLIIEELKGEKQKEYTEYLVDMYYWKKKSKLKKGDKII